MFKRVYRPRLQCLGLLLFRVSGFRPSQLGHARRGSIGASRQGFVFRAYKETKPSNPNSSLDAGGCCFI